MTHPVDTHVGNTIRQRRRLIGLTQQQLAERVGIRFQQIQKYETGMNRVSASRLWDISNTLDVPVSLFFDGISESTASAIISHGFPSNILADRDALNLLRSFYSIPETQRLPLLELARAIGRAV